MTYILLCHVVFWIVAAAGAIGLVVMIKAAPESALLYLVWDLLCVFLAFLRFYVFL